MNTKWLKKFIRKASEVKLTAHDKRTMLLRILGPKSIPSPYSFFLTVMEYRRRIVVAGVLLAFLLTSGGTSYAATNALPGEPLYSIKVNVNENIQSFVAVTPDAKAKVEVKHTQTRLAEAEELSKKGRFDAEAQSIIETKIDEHTEALKLNIAELASENATDTVKKVISDLTTSFEVHEAILTELASGTTTSSDIQDSHIDALISKVNEVKSAIDIIGKNVAAGTSTATSTPINTLSAATSTLAIVSSSTPEVTASTTSDIIDRWTSSSSVSQETSRKGSSSRR